MSEPVQLETIALSAADRRDTRQGLTLLMDQYEKIEKSAEKVTDFKIVADAKAARDRLLSLRNRFADPKGPDDQLGMFEAEEADGGGAGEEAAEVVGALPPGDPRLGAEEGLTEPDDTF